MFIWAAAPLKLFNMKMQLWTLLQLRYGAKDNSLFSFQQIRISETIWSFFRRYWIVQIYTHFYVSWKQGLVSLNNRVSHSVMEEEVKCWVNEMHF